tara:strand:- start:494 stop:742 length:249 start_codon:yes stop_codon:yes gene_type:complete
VAERQELRHPQLALQEPQLALQEPLLAQPEQEAREEQLAAHPQEQEAPADHFPAPSMEVAGRTGGRLLLLVSLCCWMKISAR